MEPSPQPLEYRRIEPILTKGQLQTLAYHKMFHDHPPTVGWLFKKWLPRLLLAFVVFAALGAIGWYLHIPWLMAFCAGVIYGSVIIQFRSFRLVASRWPALDRVINWDEVDRLLNQQTST